MELMQALNIVRQLNQLTLEQVAENMNKKLREFPQPGDHDYTQKEVSRLLNSEKMPTIRTFNILLCALSIKHQPIKFL